MIRGFSTIEVLVALTIATMTLIGVALVTLGMPDVIVSTRMHREGSMLASSGFSHEMARGTDGFPLITSYVNETNESFEVVLSAELVGDGSVKHIDSTSAWKNSWGISRSTSVRGFATDYKNAADYSCSPFPIGDWESPSVYDLTSSLPFALPPLAGLVATRDSLIAIAPMTVNLDDPSLFVLSIGKDERSSELIGTFDNATSTRTGYSAVAASSNILYAVTAHQCGGGIRCASLQILSVSDSSISLIASMPVSPARSIKYWDGKIYIGTLTSAVDPELIIIDVSDPSSPVRVGDAEIGANVNDILVQGAIAYVATADGRQDNARSVIAFDISHPHQGMTPFASAWQGGGASTLRLAISGSMLHLGRTFFNARELYVVDTGDLSHPLQEAFSGRTG